MTAVTTLMDTVGTTPALSALGLSPATYYRHRAQKERETLRSVPRSSPRKLSDAECARVLDVLHEPRFVDCSPAHVHAQLLDEDVYLCSERTMYRILAANEEVRERRNQLRHPAYEKPELVATRPNEVWSWDISKLLTFTKWTYLYLYVIMDIFSRYIVGWMLAEHENATLAKRLVDETYTKHGIIPGQLVLHSDRGSPMRAKTFSQLLADLDVTQSFSRPHVSDDNPFSESFFKTTKYHPGFPKKFSGIEHGREYFRAFFPWYNEHHKHSALAYLTPEDVHFGRADQLLDKRHAAMLAAYHAHPERFVKGIPRRPQLPPAVWINPPSDQSTGVRPLGQGEKPQGAWGTESPTEATGESSYRARMETPVGEASPTGAPRHLQGARVAPQQSPILQVGGEPC